MFDSAYFENLIEMIDEIRVSARASYQKVADLFSTSFDYDADSIIAKRFYKGLLEKIRFVVQRRSKHASGGNPTEERAVHLRTGTVNFEKLLSAGELKALDRCLAEYLDFAEMRATNKVPTAMEDWEKQLAGFLVFSELGALDLP